MTLPIPQFVPLGAAKGFSLEYSTENATPICTAVIRNIGGVKHLDTHSDRVGLLKTREVLFLRTFTYQCGFEKFHSREKTRR